MYDENTISFLKSRGRTVKFRYELLDRNDNLKKVITKVQQCTVTYNSLSQLKTSARIVMSEENVIDYLNDRIKVICIVIKGDIQREYSLGVFLISAPGRNINGKIISRDMELFSKLQLYNDDKLEERYVVPLGTNVTTEVIRLVETHKHRIIESGKTTSVSREWEIGTTKLQVINDLLETINYTSLRVSNDGYFEATPYILPQNRAVELDYIDDNASVIFSDMNDDFDLFSVPNVFIRYTNNAESDCLRAEYENINPDSVTSTVSRGRRIVDCENVTDVADLDTLNSVTRRAATEASQIYSHITFDTSIMPIHWYMNTLHLRLQGVIDGIYEETGWEINCSAGSKMKHVVRKVVEV